MLATSSRTSTMHNMQSANLIGCDMCKCVAECTTKTRRACNFSFCIFAANCIIPTLFL